MIRLRRSKKVDWLSDRDILMSYVRKVVDKYVKKCGIVFSYLDDDPKKSQEIKVSMGFGVEDSEVAIKSIYKAVDVLCKKNLQVRRADVSEGMEFIILYIMHKGHIKKKLPM